MGENVYRSNKAPFRVDVYSWQKGVTGTMTLLVINYEDGRKPIHGLIDAGIVQGMEEEKRILHFDPQILDFIIITHAHADHVGKLALLYKQGCKAKIYTSHMTDSLLQLALPDAEKIMMTNRKFLGEKPLYSAEDTNTAIQNICGNTFFNWFEVAENVQCLLVDNGHMLGACSVFLQYVSPVSGNEIVHFFTGDFKLTNPLKNIRGVKYALELYPDLKNKNIIAFSEATYGENGRSNQRDEDEKANVFINEVARGIKEGKTILIPSFSLERPALILLQLAIAQKKKLLSTSIPIYITGYVLLKFLKLLSNSKYTKVEYMPENVKILEDICDTNGEETYVKEALLPLNDDPKIIIASSGMCQYGATVTLLPEYLPSQNAKIIFPCYLAEGTIGRVIKETKEDHIFLQGRLIKIRAQIVHTSQFSGHASPEEILEILKLFDNLKCIAFHHGEDVAIRDFGFKAQKEFPNIPIVKLGDEWFFRTYPYGLNSAKPLPRIYERVKD